MTVEPLLRVESLQVDYPGPAGTVHALRGVDFDIAPQEALGVVGESGAGKSQIALSMLGLLPPNAEQAGTIWFEGRPLREPSQWRRVRGAGIGIVFQDPLMSLNPYLTLGTQLTEALRLHHRLGRVLARERAVEMLQRVGIGAASQRLAQFPHEISGGMRQRVALAMALLCQPRLLIADEPTSALDVTIQAQVLELIRDLRAQLRLTMLLITHDLAIIAQTCDRVLVVYAGRVVESAPTAQLLAAPRHPYTRGLLAARPQLKAPEALRLQGIPGAPPDPRKLAGGCSFSPRCSRADAACAQAPGLIELAPQHYAACWHPHPG